LVRLSEIRPASYPFEDAWPYVAAIVDAIKELAN
jgi:hypothetical protein